MKTQNFNIVGFLGTLSIAVAIAFVDWVVQAPRASAMEISNNSANLVVTIREFISLQEGFQNSPNAPFIVRNAKEFSEMPLQEALVRLRASEDTVFGYDTQGNYVEDLKIAQLISNWEQNQPHATILDSYLHVFDLPNALSAHHSLADIDLNKEELGQTVILSRANGYTPLHMDPPIYGGGWMYLWQGQKDWHFLSPQWMTLLFNTSEKKLLDASPETLAEIASKSSIEGASAALFHSVRANAGDFVYFPPGWMHRVWTYDKGIGLGGYIRPESTRPGAKEVEDALALFGLKAIWK